MALKQIKNKIISTKKTGKVTKAMEAVSAVKMRKSQERAFLSRPYIHSALRILARVSKSEEALAHPLVRASTGVTTLLVVVTSDKGLAGSVNSAVLKQVEKMVSADKACAMIAVGKKAVEFTERSQIECIATYTNVSDGVSLSDVEGIAQQVVSTYSQGTFRRVVIVYQNFVSTFEQEPTSRTILPLDPAEIHYIMQGIRPKTGRFSTDTTTPDTVINYTIEPSAEKILSTLIPQLVQIMVYHALLESKASEHSARMVAMKNATDKSKEIIKSLTVKFNKARQAKITAEISEITAGVAAME